MGDDNRGTSGRDIDDRGVPPPDRSAALDIPPELQKRLSEIQKEKEATSPVPDTSQGQTKVVLAPVWLVPVWHSRRIYTPGSDSSLPEFEYYLEWEPPATVSKPTRKVSSAPPPAARPAPRPQKPPASPATVVSPPDITAENRGVADRGTGVPEVPQPAKLPSPTPAPVAIPEPIPEPMRYGPSGTERYERGAPSAGNVFVPHADDIYVNYLTDLAAISGPEAISPRRAAAIKERTGLTARNVSDPKAQAAALLGFETILTVASIYTPFFLPATLAVMVIGLARGDTVGVAVNAAMLPLGAVGKLGNLAKSLGTLVKPSLKGIRVVSGTMKEYQALARLLLTKEPDLMALAKAVKPLTDKVGRSAVLKGARYLRQVAEATGDAAQASSEAGSYFHELVAAAGPGEGADFLVRNVGDVYYLELKTHWDVGMDALMIARGNEQSLAYVIRDILETGAMRGARAPSIAALRARVKGAGLGARVVHVFVDSKTGEAVWLEVNVLDFL